MEPARLMIYELRTTDQGPYAVVRALGRKVELYELQTGDLIDCENSREVVLKGYLPPPTYKLVTIRRAEDKLGIELVHRTPELDGTKPLHTLYPHDTLEQLLTGGKGYFVLEFLLRRYGL